MWRLCTGIVVMSRGKLIAIPKLKGSLKSQGLKVGTFNGSLLWEPWQVNKQDGTYYKVFTPFYRKGCLQAEPPREPLAKPENVQLCC